MSTSCYNKFITSITEKKSLGYASDGNRVNLDDCDEEQEKLS
jgi:hypothetical protein